MKEITIIAANRTGLLAEVTEVLEQAQVNIEAIDASEVGGVGRIDMIVSEYDEALDALQAAGMRPVTEDAVVIRLRDKPGALATVARQFADAEINLRSILSLHRSEGWTFVALGVDRTPQVMELIADIVVDE